MAERVPSDLWRIVAAHLAPLDLVAAGGVCRELRSAALAEADARAGSWHTRVTHVDPETNRTRAADLFGIPLGRLPPKGRLERCEVSPGGERAAAVIRRSDGSAAAIVARPDPGPPLVLPLSDAQEPIPTEGLDAPRRPGCNLGDVYDGDRRLEWDSAGAGWALDAARSRDGGLLAALYAELRPEPAVAVYALPEGRLLGSFEWAPRDGPLTLVPLEAGDCVVGSRRRGWFLLGGGGCGSARMLGGARLPASTREAVHVGSNLLGFPDGCVVRIDARRGRATDLGSIGPVRLRTARWVSDPASGFVACATCDAERKIRLRGWVDAKSLLESLGVAR